MRLRALFKAWNTFWFTRISPAPICVFRIMYGLLALGLGVWRTPLLLCWFGTHGVITVRSVQSECNISRLNLLLWLHQNDQVTIALFAIYMLCAAALMIGFCTRTSAFLTWFLLLSFNSRNPLLLGHADILLVLCGFILIFSPAGQMFSLDSWLKRNRSASKLLPMVWSQRLLQVEMVAIYWQVFVSKIFSSKWLDGSAIYYVTHIHYLERFPLPYISEHFWASQLLTWAVIAVEFLLCTLILVKKFRYWVMLLGLILHLGMDWSLNIPLLQYVMISLYTNFVDPKHISLLFEKLKLAKAYSESA